MFFTSSMFQDMNSVGMLKLVCYHDKTLMVLMFISILVAGGLGFSYINETYFTEYLDFQKLEFLWTVLPTIILLAMAYPSMKALYFLDEVLFSDITMKAIGHQWYWSYEDNGIISFQQAFAKGFEAKIKTSKPVVPLFKTDIKIESPTITTIDTVSKDPIGLVGKICQEDPNILSVKITKKPLFVKKITKYDSRMVQTSDLKSGGFRLLETDKLFHIFSDLNTKILVTSADVLHSWTVPSFGIKMDATPGKTLQSVLSPFYSGIFHGQCSEICGANHSFMPIQVEVMDPITLKFPVKIIFEVEEVIKIQGLLAINQMYR